MKTSKEEYAELLKIVPDHLSYEFINFLRDNNEVIEDNDDWLVIENCKYHRAERPWYTAFLKKDNANIELKDLFPSERRSFVKLVDRFKGLVMTIKPKSERTIKRFHVHFFK